MPHVTADMLEWWFEWLNHKPAGVPSGQGNLRYKIWCPPDHWDHEFLDEKDHAAGFRICESLDLGGGAPKKHMINKSADPAAVGITPDMQRRLQDAGIPLKFGMGCDENGNPGGVGLNTFRDTKEGCVWASRGWGGYAVQDNSVLLLTPGPADPAAMRTELLHNLLERRRLDQILPEIYDRFHKEPME